MTMLKIVQEQYGLFLIKKENHHGLLLRTLEKLQNGNWLITGSQTIGQVTNDGELVWELYFPEFRHQRDKNKEKTFIYKVTL